MTLPFVNEPEFHGTVSVASSVKFGERVIVWQFSSIGHDVEIGNDVVIGSNVWIMERQREEKPLVHQLTRTHWADSAPGRSHFLVWMSAPIEDG